jgi:hypothetical protein
MIFIEDSYFQWHFLNSSYMHCAVADFTKSDHERRFRKGLDDGMAGTPSSAWEEPS